MQCYSWENGELVPGIDLQSGALILGTQSEHGAPVRVPLHSKNPAQQISGKILETYPFWVNPQNGEPFLTFAQPHEKHQDDSRALLRLTTSSTLNHTVQGFWKGIAGSPKTLLVGIGTNQDQTWREALVILQPDDVIRVRPEGSDDMWAIVHTGEQIRSETWIRHEARGLLLEEGIL